MEKKEFEKNHVPANSSMALNEEEVNHLGKQMEHRRTGEELKAEYDKVPDPQQYQDEKK